MDEMIEARLAMAAALARQGIANERVLDALRRVPRERFVDERQRDFAYEDGPLPIGGGQTISQPYVVALMAEAAELDLRSRVLEVGGGCGYAAAVYGLLAGEVISLELDQKLAEEAAGRIAALGYRNVIMRRGDGTSGLLEEAPFDAILVAAAAKEVPLPLLEQLAPGGRLIIPVGTRWGGQRLMKISRGEDGAVKEEFLADVRFVRLVTPRN